MDIYELCRKGDVEGLKSFISSNKDFDLNKKNNDGNTPLMVSILCNTPKSEIIKILLENNANPDIQDNKGETVLHKMCKSDFNNIAEIFKSFFDFAKKFNINIKSTSGKTPLEVCMTQEKIPENIVEILLKNNGMILDKSSNDKEILNDYNKKYKKSSTHKMINIFFNTKNINLLNLLIKYANKIDHDYLLKLYIKAPINNSNHKGILEKILNKGGKLSTKNESNEDCFDVWLKSNHNPKILSFILSKNDDINPNKSPSFVERYLCNNESINLKELAQILNKTDKSTLTKRFKNGETALTQICKLAYTRGNRNINKLDISKVDKLVELCIQHGAMVNQKNKNNQSPMEIIADYMLYENVKNKPVVTT